jgi:hypothetical protein
MGEKMLALPNLVRSFIYVMFLLIVVSCNSETAERSAVEGQADATEETSKPTIPDPSGSYSDREGGLSFTFLSTGKFYQELMGETSFGTWRRSGGEVEITYDDGSSTSVKLGVGFVEFNGMRLTK